MTKFEQWWEKEEANILRLVEGGGSAMDDMRRIAELAWNAATVGAAKTLEERIKKTDLAVLKAEKEQDEETAIYLRSTSWVLGLLVSEIKGMKSEQV